jgi:hypothetical protein
MAETLEEPSDDVRIRRSWAKAVAAGDLVGRLFYSNLFEIAPATRPMFPEVIEDQAKKLLQTLNWIIDHLDDMETLVPAFTSEDAIACYDSSVISVKNLAAVLGVGAAVIYASEN